MPCPDLPTFPASRSTNADCSNYPPVQRAVNNLYAKFEDVVGILQTSEMNRQPGRSHHALGQSGAREGGAAGNGGSRIVARSSKSIELLNSENSPYGCDETVQSLGMKLWGYQAGFANSPSLEDMVIQYLPIPLRHSAQRFLAWDDPETLIEQLGENGLINADILWVFRALGIDALNLSNSHSPDPVNNSKALSSAVACSTLAVFALPNSFKQLRSLCLRRIPLQNSDVAFLSGLESLHTLDLSHTGVGCEATAHLVTLKQSLGWLSLAYNPKIRHASASNLSYLRKLETLHLAGTGVKLLSLRYLAQKYGGSKQRMAMTVPATCQKTLEGANRRYVNLIPDPYVPVHKVASIDVMVFAELRRNLEFHAQADPSLSLKGSADELAKRLEKHLKRRDADLSLRKWVKAAKNA